MKKSRGRQYLEQLNSSSKTIKTITGGAFSSIKTEEEKDQERNVTVVKSKPPQRQSTQPISKNQKKISDEKLQRFINFRI